MKRIIVLLAAVLCLLAPGLVLAIPNINVTPSNLDFGQVEVGQSNTLQITVTNTGNATLSVDRLQFFDNQSQVLRPNYPGVSSQSNNIFTFMDNTFTVNMPIDIPAGQSVQIDIVFAPALYGPVNGMFWVYSNAATAPRISYTADGVALGSLSPPPPSATYTLNPTAIDFGALNVGQSVTRQFTIRNTDATNPLNVFLIVASSLDFNSFTSTDFSAINSDVALYRPDFSDYVIAPGGQQVFSIAFHAITLGSKSGTIEPVTDGTASGPSTIPFTANVVAPQPPAPPPPAAYVEPPPAPGASFFVWDEGDYGRHFYVTDKLVVVKSVLWNFGDGIDSGKLVSLDGTSSSKALNPLHVYSVVGQYTATLTMEASLNGRDTTYVSSQTVHAGPALAVAAAPAPSDAGQTIKKNLGSKMVKATTKVGGGHTKRPTTAKSTLKPAGKMVAVQAAPGGAPASWAQVKASTEE